MKRGILLILGIAAVIVLSGCTQEGQPSAGQKTCSQLGGYACNENEQCFGTVLSASDAGTCCAVVCTQKSAQDETGIKSCSEQGGFICKSGEKCEGTTLESSDAATCCSAECAAVEVEAEEKTLEEINLKEEDFPEAFVLNDLVSGYQKNALEYADGNSERANDLLEHGWQENYAVDFIRRSETQEIMGTKIILEEYSSSLSRYDKAKDYANYFKDAIEEYQTILEEGEGVTILSQKFGDNSVLAKSTETNEFTGLTTVSYVLYFIKDNVFVNFFAAGQSRQITDEKLIEYARKVESRIG